MSKQIGARTREKWVDDVKVIACILVVVGHFFMSMVQSGILPDSNLHEWFITTIYYFHVPLFFICSGKQCGKLAQKCGEKGVGTRHTLCDLFYSYLGIEKGIFEQC